MEARWPGRERLRRIAGLALMLGAIVGAALVIIGLFGLVFSLGGVEQSLDEELDNVAQALDVTADGLDTAALALGDAQTTVSALSDTLGGATSAITDTLPTLDTVASLAGSDLPNSLRATQAALGSARETARVVDRVLSTVSSFGLLTSATYNPEVPLNEAIAEVSAGLDSLPPSLGRVSAGIDIASANLEEINTSLSVAAAGLDDISGSLRQTLTIVHDYQEVVADLQADLAALREQLPGWFTGLRLGVGLALLWLALAQVSLVLQGWALLTRRL